MLPFRFITGLIYACGAALTIYFADTVGESGLSGFLYFSLFAGGLLWMILGYRFWWLPLFFGLGFGGVFYFGFKVNTYEAGLAAGIAAIIPALALNRAPFFHGRRAPFFLLLGFLLYLGGHACWSLLRSPHHDLVSLGSIARSYFKAAWGPLFVLLFYRFGNTTHFRWTLYAVEAAYTLRVFFGLAAFFWPTILYLPGVNFVFAGSAGLGDSFDLRWSGLGLVQFSLALLMERRRPLLLPLHNLLLLLGTVAVVVGGGRVVMACALLSFLFAALYARRWILLGLAGCVIAGGLLWINLNPHIIDSLPERARRSASGLIVKKAASWAQRENQSSDEWHLGLQQIGYQRWTHDPRSFLFGEGARPYDWTVFKEADSTWRLHRMLYAAADSGNYESGLWNALGVLGLVGALCELTLFGWCFVQLWRLSAIAWRDDLGRPLAFLGFCLPLQWFLICYFQGDPPSPELAVAAVAVFYLQDRARERKQSTASS